MSLSANNEIFHSKYCRNKVIEIKHIMDYCFIIMSLIKLNKEILLVVVPATSILLHSSGTYIHTQHELMLLYY